MKDEVSQYLIFRVEVMASTRLVFKNSLVLSTTNNNTVVLTAQVPFQLLHAGEE